MKNTLCLITVAVLCALFVMCSSVAFAETAQPSTDDSLYTFMTEFVNANTERSDEKSELAAANWLKAVFDNVLPDGTESKVERGDVNGEYIYNVTARISGNNAKQQIIVGAHFDAVSHSAGVTDNACGVAVLYGVMKRVSQAVSDGNVSDYDIVFVAFGGEERGLLGSQYYVDHMSDEQRDGTLLMINFDNVAGGDDLYLHCENKSTSLADYLVNLGGGNIAEKPYRKGVYNSFDTYGYGYYEEIQGSDHTPFRLAGIPVALFFSGNYDNFDYVQSVDETNCVFNTIADSLTHAETIRSTLVAQMNTVCDVAATALTSADFASVAMGARKQIVNLDVAYGGLIPKLVAVGVIVICAILFVPYYRKLQKRAIMGTAEVKTGRVFNQPDADDIFTFDK